MIELLKKYGFWIGLLVFIILVVYNINSTNNELKKNGIVLNARIIDITGGGKSSLTFKYTFAFEGSNYEREDATQIIGKSLFIGKTFPVIFSPKSKVSRLLMGPKNFQNFDIPFPDSLTWILEYRKNK